MKTIPGSGTGPVRHNVGNSQTFDSHQSLMVKSTLSASKTRLNPSSVLPSPQTPPSPTQAQQTSLPISSSPPAATVPQTHVVVARPPCSKTYRSSRGNVARHTDLRQGSRSCTHSPRTCPFRPRWGVAARDYRIIARLADFGTPGAVGPLSGFLGGGRIWVLEKWCVCMVKVVWNLGRGDVCFGEGWEGCKVGWGTVDQTHAFSVGRSWGIRDAVCKASWTPSLTCNRCRVAVVTTLLVAESGATRGRSDLTPSTTCRVPVPLYNAVFTYAQAIPRTVQRSPPRTIIQYFEITTRSLPNLPWKNTDSPRAAYAQTLTASRRLKSITAPIPISPHPKNPNPHLSPTSRDQT